MGQGPLSGRRIMVTRAARQAGGLSSLLAKAGADVVVAPLIAIEPVRDLRAARRSLRRVGEVDYLVFTSANAVGAYAAIASEAGIPLPTRIPSPQVVAVGPATAAAVRKVGMTPREVPRTFSGAAVADLLATQDLRGKRVVIPRAQVAGQELPTRLRQAGASVEVVSLYRTVADPEAPRIIPGLIRSGLDVVTFTSPSAVRSFSAAVGNGFRRPRRLVVACIGPVTARAAAAAGLDPDVIAPRHTAAGLVDALRAFYQRRPAAAER
jgi:uroporphyrinogen-III synthase